MLLKLLLDNFPFLQNTGDMMKYKTRAIICAFSASVLIMSNTGCGKAAADPGMVCNTYITERTELENTVSATGTVEGADAVSITSDLNAKVSKLYVSVGSIVKAGDVLCEFDRSDIQRQIDSLTQEMEIAAKKQESEHEAHLRDLALAQSQKDISLRVAQRSIDEAVSKQSYAYSRYNELAARQQELYNTIASLNQQIASAEDPSALIISRDSAEKNYSTVSEQLSALGGELVAYDNAVANAQDNYNRTSIEADYAIQAANAVLSSDSYPKDLTAQQKLDELNSKLSECTVIAPGSGIVTSLSVKEGSIPTTDSIMTIADDTSLIINATVYETDILRIFEGQSCEISMIANSDKTYSGKILSVIKIRDDKSVDSTVYAVRISIDNVDESVIIGMSTQITIITEKKEDIIAVPYEAVVTGEDGKEYVFVAEEESDGSYTARRKEVTSGMETSYLSEITGDVGTDEMILFPADRLS